MKLFRFAFVSFILTAFFIVSNDAYAQRRSRNNTRQPAQQADKQTQSNSTQTEADDVLAISVLVRTNPRNYHIHWTNTASVNGNSVSYLVLDLSLPVANHYQDITNVNWQTSPSIGVDKLSYPETGEPYISAAFRSPRSSQAELSLDLDVMLYTIETDFSRISKIYPYNKNSSLYKTYTRQSENYVVPSNSTIRSVSRKLAGESNDVLEYARKAYQYVKDHYQKLNNTNNINSLNSVLSNGGGSIAELSSVLISLLCANGIPARHVAGNYPDGEYGTIFAEFYLEKYGWIPADFHNGGFGHVTNGTMPVITHYDAGLSVRWVNQNRLTSKSFAYPNVPFSYWWTGNSESTVMGASHFKGEIKGIERSVLANNTPRQN